MKILINLSKVWKFSKQISIKQKKVKILTSFLFINFVIFSDLLIISILNYLITGEITSNQYISFLFNSFAAFYFAYYWRSWYDVLPLNFSCFIHSKPNHCQLHLGYFCGCCCNSLFLGLLRLGTCTVAVCCWKCLKRNIS